MKTNIEMAREAGGYFAELPKGDAWLFDKEEQLEAFAELVRADEREECAKVADEYIEGCEGTNFGVGKVIRARGQPLVCCEEYNTCVRPCTPRGRHHGQKEEREACAKLCDWYVDSSSDHEAGTAMNIQDAIRARGQA